MWSAEMKERKGRTAMAEDTVRRVNGTLVWYWAICKRQVWLMARQITPSHEDDNLLIGRALHESAYGRERKEVHVENLKLDLMRTAEGELVVGEVKKSSRYAESARLQLTYYLYRLWKLGVEAKGRLHFPLERKTEDVVLDEKTVRQMAQMEREIAALIDRETPVPAEWSRWCRKCAYRELCWA